MMGSSQSYATPGSELPLPDHQVVNGPLDTLRVGRLGGGHMEFKSNAVPASPIPRSRTVLTVPVHRTSGSTPGQDNDE